MTIFTSMAPEFEPTRDDFPWRYWPPYGSEVREKRYATRADAMRDPSCGTGGVEWAPRDRNRNRILVAFRKRGTDPKVWLTQSDDYWHSQGYTPAEVEHARKVLTRLANVYKED